MSPSPIVPFWHQLNAKATTNFWQGKRVFITRRLQWYSAWLWPNIWHNVMHMLA